MKTKKLLLTVIAALAVCFCCFLPADARIGSVDCVFEYPSGVAAADVSCVWVDGSVCTASPGDTYFTAPVPAMLSCAAVQLICKNGDSYLYLAENEGSGSFSVTHAKGGDSLLSACGFAIRTAGAQGMRFKAGIACSAFSAGVSGLRVTELGILMKKSGADELLYIDDTYSDETHTAKSVSYSLSEGINKCLYEKDGTRVFSTVLMNISDEDYSTGYDMRAYCVISDGKNSYTVYGDTYSKSIKETAAAVIGDEENSLAASERAYMNILLGRTTDVSWEGAAGYIWSANGGAYPRMGQLSDGTLLAVYRYGAYIYLRRSTNAGLSWSADAVKVTPSFYADKTDAACEGFDVTNPEIIVLPDDTILVSFRVNKDCGSVYYASIRVYESTDKGKSFHFHSTVIENTSVSGGLWEPYFCMIDDDGNPATPDRLAVYYCNDMTGKSIKPQDFVASEGLVAKGMFISGVYPGFATVSSSSYQNVMVQLWDEDSGKWEAPKVASDGKRHNSRDGMMTVTRLSDGSYAMTIESSRYRTGAEKSPDGLAHRMVVRMLFSDNGLDWTDPVDIYIPTGMSPDGNYASYAGAPYVVLLPDGRVAVSFHSNENYNKSYIVNTNGMGGQRYNCTMRVIISDFAITRETRNSVGTGTFSEAFEPIPVDTNGYSIWCGMYVYNGKYLLAFAATGVNTSSTVYSTRKLTVRRALLVTE